MAASCFAIPLSSSSRSPSNVIPKYKILISSTSSCYSYLESMKPQFPSSTSFHLSSLSRPFVAQPLHIKVSSSELSVLDEEEVKEEGVVKTGEGETDGDTVVSEAAQVAMKKPRPCEFYVCNIPRSYDIAQILEMFQPFGTVLYVEEFLPAD